MSEQTTTFLEQCFLDFFHIWQKTKHSIPTAKHGGGRVMIWACSVVTGPGHLAINKSAVQEFRFISK